MRVLNKHRTQLPFVTSAMPQYSCCFHTDCSSAVPSHVKFTQHCYVCCLYRTLNKV